MPNLRSTRVRLISYGFFVWSTIAVFSAASLTPGTLRADPRMDLEGEAIRAGLVVQAITPASALARAGIQVGDRLLAWQVAGRSRQALSSHLDWEWVVREWSPRGPVTLFGEREGRPMTFEVAPTFWGGTVRPPLEGALLQAYLMALEKSAARAPADAARLLTEAAPLAPPGPVRVWLHLRAAELWYRATKWAEAQAAFRAARDSAEDHVGQALGWEGIAATAERLNRHSEAKEAFETMIRLWPEPGQPSLGIAKPLDDLGRVLKSIDRLDEAEQSQRRALSITRELAPQSLALARTLLNWGALVATRGDMRQAETAWTEAAALQEKLAPETADMAVIWANLGGLWSQRGRLDLAEQYLRRSLSLGEKIGARLDVANVLKNMGNLEIRRGDLEAAEENYRRALGIYEEMVPNSTLVAFQLRNLGMLELERQDFRAAEPFLVRAFEIQEKLAPGGSRAAIIRAELGRLAREQGRYTESRQQLEAALPAVEKAGVSALDVALVLFELGETALAAGQAADADRYFERTAAIEEQLAPESAAFALCLAGRGRAARRMGDLPRAAEHLLRAADVLDAQGGQLGGGIDTQAGFRARNSPVYRELVETLLALQRPDEAFHALERYRARALLAMLAEKDLAGPADVPEELETRRRRLAADHDRLLGRLAALDAARDRAEVDLLVQDLRRVQQDRALVMDEVRRLSPRRTALQYPQPLSAEETREALDPGTALVSYSVGPEVTTVFVIDRSGLKVHSVPLGQQALHRDTEAFRSLIQDIRSSPTLDPRGRQLWQMARRLYDALMRPVEASLRDAERVVILPDGPLHRLPFAALVRAPRNSPAFAPRGQWRYLVEWKPLHVAASASVYAELKRWRVPSLPAAPLVAFGDPVIVPTRRAASADAAGEAATLGRTMERLRTRGFHLEPLPASRREVQSIARVYGEHATALLGAAATEEKAKSIEKDVRYLHFATHVVLDDRLPLDSAIVLSTPDPPGGGRDNGLLESWEVFESLHLDADLVVLSGCESGLGQNLEGEGLLGLTQAFHYAGARSILASLWPAADEATADLMARFYAHLKRGTSKDQALRQAQLEMLSPRPAKAGRSPDSTSAPYYWALFQLRGDWK